MNLELLESAALQMVSANKGLLAADESTGTISKRLASVGLASTEESRRDYREMLFRTEGLGQYISGAILYDETIRQESKNGIPLTRLLIDQGILPGIKVDKGAKALAGSDG